ncbi:MAG: hypothetical protein L3J45_07140 [Flavobacteriaceae bacterium]|nr:hypothetical protein [Flavobacteriaceae bacterium]
MKNKLHIFVFLLLSFYGFSQKKPTLEVSTDTTSIRIGEQFDYSISVLNTTAITFPILKDSLGKIEVIESMPIDTLANRLIKKYRLTGFDSGRWVIPQQKVIINNKKFLTDSIIINVATVKVDTTKQQLFPIKPIKKEPFALIDARPYLWWLIGALILIAIGLFFLLRKKVVKLIEKPVVPPFIIAMDSLKTLDSKQLIKAQRLKDFYIELIEIIRRYIEADLSIPALESTTNELLTTITDFNSSSKLDIDKETLNKLSALLKSADLVKFAKYKPNLHQSESDRLLAEFILNGLKPKEKKEAADD